MLNEARGRYFKKSIQAALTIPYFLSWVIIAGITFDIFSSHGLFNIVRSWFDLEDMLIMQEERLFRPVYVFTSLCREADWQTIVYLEAMSAIDPQLYESAMVDGASRLRQMVSITLPLLMASSRRYESGVLSMVSFNKSISIAGGQPGIRRGINFHVSWNNVRHW
jgi:putative aldouronate transport system permease protein